MRDVNRRMQCVHAGICCRCKFFFFPPFFSVSVNHTTYDDKWIEIWEKRLIVHTLCRRIVRGLMKNQQCAWFSLVTFMFIPRPLYMGEELSHFYVQSIPPEIGLHYSFCGMWFDRSVSERSVKWKYFTCELIIRGAHSPFFCEHNDLFLPLAGMKLPLSLSFKWLGAILRGDTGPATRSVATVKVNMWLS